MNLERLKNIHRRAHGPVPLMIWPVPVNGPYLVFERPLEPLRLEREPVPFALKVRNVGEEACELIGVSGAGISVSGAPTGLLLKARTPQEGALRLEARLLPFSLPDAAKEAVLEFQVRPSGGGGGGGGSLAFPCSVPIQWELAGGPVLLHDPPELVFDRLRVQNLHPFVVRAPDAQVVSLHIEEPPTEKPSYPMRRRNGGDFIVALPLGDGTYSYRFCVDGRFQPDLNQPIQVYVRGVQTPCSQIKVSSGNRQSLLLRNAGSEKVRLEAESRLQWINLGDKKLDLRPGQAREIEVTLKAEGLPIGEHTGAIVLHSNDGDREIPVRARLAAPGPIPDLPKQDYDFGTVYFGVAAEKAIEVRNLGSDVLTGWLVSDDPYITADSFEIPARPEPAKVTLTIHPRGTPPQRPETRSPKLELRSNTPVHGKESLVLRIQYRVDTMRFNPEQLDFGDVSPGETRTLTGALFRGDGSPIEKEIQFKEARPWLRAVSDWHGNVAVTIDGSKFPESRDMPIRGELRLVEAATGMGGALPIRGQFLIPRAHAKELDFGVVRLGDRKALPLPIFNDGKGKLIVKEIVLDQLWLEVERGPIRVVVNFSNAYAAERRGLREALVQVVTNDPRPEGRVLRIPVRVKLTG
jgi:hypothetical protein